MLTRKQLQQGAVRRRARLDTARCVAWAKDIRTWNAMRRKTLGPRRGGRISLLTSVEDARHL